MSIDDSDYTRRQHDDYIQVCLYKFSEYYKEETSIYGVSCISYIVASGSNFNAFRHPTLLNYRIASYYSGLAAIFSLYYMFRSYRIYNRTLDIKKR